MASIITITNKPFLFELFAVLNHASFYLNSSFFTFNFNTLYLPSFPFLPFYFLILSCLYKKHPSHVIDPHPHVLGQCVHLQPDQGVAALFQTSTDLGLIQWDHRDLYPRTPKIVTLSQSPNEQEVATRPQEPPNVAQGPGEGSQVRADALQAEAGHETVSPC